MPITITKTKTKTAASDFVELNPFAARIDEAGKLKASIDKMEEELAVREKKALESISLAKKKLKALVEPLYVDLNKHYDESNPDQKFTESGSKFQAEIGKKGNERIIVDMPLIKELMDEQDPDLFMKLVTMTLGNVDNYLTVDERAAVTETKRVKREIKINKVP